MLEKVLRFFFCWMLLLPVAGIAAHAACWDGTTETGTVVLSEKGGETSVFRNVSFPRVSPLDEACRERCEALVDSLLKVHPDMGGLFLNVGNSTSGKPTDFGCTHAEMANAMATPLKVKGLRLLYMATAVNDTLDADPIKRPYLEFTPLDGQFADNVILLIPHGLQAQMPIEPINPLFFAMRQTTIAPLFESGERREKNACAWEENACRFVEDFNLRAESKRPKLPYTAYGSFPTEEPTPDLFLGIPRTEAMAALENDFVGTDRTENGTQFVMQYPEPIRSIYNIRELCPEEFLLILHRLPWDYVLKNGKTVREELAAPTSPSPALPQMGREL